MEAVILVLILVGISILFVISIRWTTRKGAPWEPTSMEKVHAMLQLARVKPGDVVIDLGCGDGRIPITAARVYGARAVGIEIDPIRYAIAWLCVRFLGLRDLVEIRRGDIFQEDISRATVVTCYLLQDTNDRLLNKFQRELSPDTRVVSNTYTFQSMVPDQQQENLYLFIIKNE